MFLLQVQTQLTFILICWTWIDYSMIPRWKEGRKEINKFYLDYFDIHVCMCCIAFIKSLFFPLHFMFFFRREEHHWNYEFFPIFRKSYYSVIFATVTFGSLILQFALKSEWNRESKSCRIWERDMFYISFGLL